MLYRQLMPASTPALEGIKAAGQKDWRALAEWLKLTFPERRPGHSISISTTAVAQQGIVISEEKRQALIAQRERILKAAAATT
ncbi:MAG: hypothetical protein DME50_09830 [Verrucomicrobia bacterium]|nr:MAG: hypothetical protein DME50_09830 [Verrucomicrobiota bacterium]